MVRTRRDIERTRPTRPSLTAPTKHVIRVDGLRIYQFLISKGGYELCYPQVLPSPTASSVHATHTHLIRPVDPRPSQFNLLDLECLKVLGEGATGQVVLVRSIREKHRLDRPGSMYALKVCKKEQTRLADSVEPAHKDIERSILTKLPWNPFVAGILQVFADEVNLYTLMEFIPGGSLRGLLQTRAPFDATCSAFYFSNIVAGLDFLEAHNVYHRDLKPENILVGPDGYLVLADFGEGAHEYDYKNTKWVQIGTPVYAAPELLSNNMDEENLTFSGVDWWSAGIILYEMTYRKLPWWGRNEIDIHRRKTSGKLKWRHGVKVGWRLKSLISGLLTVETATRLGANGAQEVMNHEWLRQIKWSQIKERAYLAPYVPPGLLNQEETWHKLPLPLRRKIPGLGNIFDPPSHLTYNDCFPPCQIELEDGLAGALPLIEKEKDNSNRESNWPFYADHCRVV